MVGRARTYCSPPFLLQMIVDYRLSPDDAPQPGSSSQAFRQVSVFQGEARRDGGGGGRGRELLYFRLLVPSL